MGALASPSPAAAPGPPPHLSTPTAADTSAEAAARASAHRGGFAGAAGVLGAKGVLLGPQGSAASAIDIDIEALPDKPWRRRGQDPSDYFNYGFNEQSWKVRALALLPIPAACAPP